MRLLTPLFNVTGGFALALGALYSTYMYMPKKRVMRYDLARSRGIGRFLVNLAIAPVAITVNLLASIPGTVTALFAGRLHSRVPATILLAIGGFIPSLTSGLSRFGITETFFLGELLGVVFLFAGHARLGRGVPRVPHPVHPPRPAHTGSSVLTRWRPRSRPWVAYRARRRYVDDHAARRRHLSPAGRPGPVRQKSATRP